MYVFKYICEVYRNITFETLDYIPHRIYFFCYFFFQIVQEAYGLSVTAVVAIIAVCVGWGIKWALKRFNVQCRLPVTCNGRNQGVDPPGIELRQVRVNMDEEEEEEEGDDQDTTSENSECLLVLYEHGCFNFRTE